MADFPGGNQVEGSLKGFEVFSLKIRSSTLWS